jgi:hypothetical protein
MFMAKRTTERSKTDDKPARARTTKPKQQTTASTGARLSTAWLEPSEDDIRALAYRKYLERGGSHGMDFDDWIAAEQELRQGPRAADAA